ncbi:PHB depolymerase family esterase [Aeromicrobium duanguangcaii]|uniref:PHB depolymerase family esterase n=1 Tax=Aeromicrobium duanguangcaii TaxID=2968086 RepID=UPI00201822BD|nr:PHB depolymerase family esterase [Aeromicrobium duanguangcaii]MCL3838889.1 hypothetical protein [Aeromicrobium duanguangcaii]
MSPRDEEHDSPRPWSFPSRRRWLWIALDAGSLRYQVHLPPQHGDGRRLPVIVALHGCGMSGFGWNSMKDLTQFNDLADREGFIVVYPTQRVFRRSSRRR